MALATLDDVARVIQIGNAAPLWDGWKPVMQTTNHTHTHIMKFNVSYKTAELTVNLAARTFTFDELATAWADAYVSDIDGIVNRDPEYIATCVGGADALEALKAWVKDKVGRYDLDDYFDLVWERKVKHAL